MALTNIQAKDSLLLIIDIQERLSPMISDFQSLLKNTLKLAQASCVHDIPTLISEQYVQGLGETDEKIKSVLPRATYFSKVYFSACEEAGFLDKLISFNKKTIVVVGTEAHVCVLQTCIDLLKNGFDAKSKYSILFSINISEIDLSNKISPFGVIFLIPSS